MSKPTINSALHFDETNPFLSNHQRTLCEVCLKKQTHYPLWCAEIEAKSQLRRSLRHLGKTKPFAMNRSRPCDLGKRTHCIRSNAQQGIHGLGGWPEVLRFSLDDRATRKMGKSARRRKFSAGMARPG
jgi:hypothetical protein